MIRIFESETKFNYVFDILNIEVDITAKKVKIVDTCQQEYTIQYSDEKLFKEMINLIHFRFDSNGNIDLYKNEADLQQIIEMKESQVRKPGEAPGATHPVNKWCDFFEQYR